MEPLFQPNNRRAKYMHLTPPKDTWTTPKTFTNEIEEPEGPAQGIITPQPSHTMCKNTQVYDKGLRQCISKKMRPCPLCKRTITG